MKIIDKINNEIKNDNIYYSFEYFPPKTKTGKQNLYFKIEKMAKLEPIFIDITWGAGGSTSALTLELCDQTQNMISIETQMHLTCTNMDEKLIKDSLDIAYNKGIRNILALRGDPPEGDESWKATDLKFQYGEDLVKFIRETYGEEISICVAGYPEGHPDGDYQTDLQYLKQKVDAGADFIITQLFFDVDIFIKFYQDCRNIGIKCPILPGILPIINYNSFKRMVGFCNVHVSSQILSDLENIKNDDEKVAEYGVKLCIQMCQKLIDNNIKGLHFYTLNRIDTIINVLDGLNLTKDIYKRKTLPWNPRINSQETTRPIFWANLQEYYIQRTSDWDIFPNGRWGDVEDCQYGDIKDYHLFGISGGTKKNKLKIWGKPKSIYDIKQVFVNYLKGDISYTPWCDNLILESNLILEKLIKLNHKGFLTINSQPKLNGIPSNSKYGWGGSNGYIYQKEYLEFFCNKEDFIGLSKKIYDDKYCYCAVDNEGNLLTNCQNKTITVTWGVFPQKQLIQPTVVDYRSFLIWKKDAFNHWTSIWGSLYDKESESYNLLKNIQNNYYLVFIVSNDYINGDIYEIFN